MSRIVVIHGMNHQYQSEFALQEVLRHGLRSGVAAAARRRQLRNVVPEADSIELAYYGDLFRSEPDSTQPVTGTRGPSGLEAGPLPPTGLLSAEERQLLTGWLEATDIADASGTSTSHEPVRGGSTRAGFKHVSPDLNRWIARLQEAAVPGPTTEWVARSFISHLHRYVERDNLANQVLDRLDEKVTADTKLIVGHSMGSVVAYEYLRRRCQVDPAGIVLLTIGSPIAFPYIYQNARISDWKAGMRRAPWPRVKRWHNVACENDPVAPRAAIAELFEASPGGEPLRDHLVHNGGLAHAPERYLNAPLTGELVLDALT